MSPTERKPHLMDHSPADQQPMRLAIEASREALDAGDRPYGAALVSAAGELLLVERNRQISRGDVTAHAEMLPVREASLHPESAALRGSTVCASEEPCATCAGALFWVGVRGIVFAASVGEMVLELGGGTLPIRCAEVLAGATPAIRVDGPCMADEALAVLRDAARADAVLRVPSHG